MITGLLFYDTETTGMWDRYADVTAEHQPRIVQLAALLTDADGKTMASFQSLVSPDGWKIEPGAASVHGITDELCVQYGSDIFGVINTFGRFLLRAGTIIGHNEEFDHNMMLREFALKKLNFPKRQTYCTMLATTPICKIPGRYGDYKWPKLIEAYRHFFGNDFEGAHDAMSDVLACRDIYFALRKLEPVGA